MTLFFLGLTVGLLLLPILKKGYRVSQYSFGRGYRTAFRTIGIVARRAHEEICPNCREKIGHKLRWMMNGGEHGEHK